MWDPREDGVQVQGHQSRGPIVHVKDIGAKNVSGDFERGAAQQTEPNVIIAVIPAALVINAGAVVKWRAIEEKVAHAALHHLVDRDCKLMRTKGDGHGVVDPFGVENPGSPAPRQQHGHVIAARGQSHRKGAQHVAQSAGLDKRGRLRRHHQNARHEFSYFR